MHTCIAVQRVKRFLTGPLPERPFRYSGLSANVSSVAVTVTNTGKRSGDEVVQLYFAPKSLSKQKNHPVSALWGGEQTQRSRDETAL